MEELEQNIAQELWVARELLSKEGRPKTGTKVPVSWDTYCNDIGSSRQVVNRWLQKWFA